MTFSATIIWLICAAILGILELTLTTFYLLVLAIAACAGSLAAYMNFSVEWQVIAFAVVSLIGSVWVRRIRSIKTKSDEQAHALQNLDEGQAVEVLAWKEKGRTSVQYRGAQWDAVAVDTDNLETGLHQIVEVRGNTLILKKI